MDGPFTERPVITTIHGQKREKGKTIHDCQPLNYHKGANTKGKSQPAYLKEF